ncbi:MAG: ABC transporter permease, partial [Pirellulales bacterium]|nr:ABC transporter permease [Pirellulales bacterium]
SIPNLVLLVVIAFAFSDSESDAKDTLLPVYIAFCATFWIGTCRVIRGETMKLKELEYVQAARTAGFGSMRVLFRHVLPNTSHLMLINFSLLLIGAIKSEVILSFLGLGVKSQPSWGIMIRDAGNNGDVMTGFFWQIGTATVFMFFLVLAFNILSDALQDAFDPKHL